jgi:hypothetical protein
MDLIAAEVTRQGAFARQSPFQPHAQAAESAAGLLLMSRVALQPYASLAGLKIECGLCYAPGTWRFIRLVRGGEVTSLVPAFAQLSD